MRFLTFLFLWATAALVSAQTIAPVKGTLIPGRYIVKVRRSNFAANLLIALKVLTNKPLFTYQIGRFVGFAADLSDREVILLRRLPIIEWIEQDAVVVTQQLPFLTPSNKRGDVTQTGTTWGLSRISSRSKGTNSYTYDGSAGVDTCVYIIDTGIDVAHPQFEGRAIFAANFAGDGLDTDGNGHGTHCAGTIGSQTYGVAKKTTLIGVKVLDSKGGGSSSTVLAGINYVASDVKTRTGCNFGSVASMSLGGSRSAAVNLAVSDLNKLGVLAVVAAGNDARDASNYSPASETTALAVGATNKTDGFASFSNFGAPVGMLAPGVAILSTWPNNKTRTISGTSMAAPHVAGLAAYLLSLEGKTDPGKLTSRLQSLSTKSVVTSLVAGTRNYLAFNSNSKG